MATIIRGKRKGEQVTLHQWCNDWMTTEDGEVLSPLSVRLAEDEIERVRASHAAGDVGHMFLLYDLDSDGRFRKKGR